MVVAQLRGVQFIRSSSGSRFESERDYDTARRALHDIATHIGLSLNGYFEALGDGLVESLILTEWAAIGEVD